MEEMPNSRSFKYQVGTIIDNVIWTVNGETDEMHYFVLGNFLWHELEVSLWLLLTNQSLKMS